MSPLPACPRCGQDWVRPARIIVSGEVLQMCDECLATWPLGAEVLKATFTQLHVFLEARGLPDDTRMEAVETPSNGSK